MGRYGLIVVGGGAAGVFCAIRAAERLQGLRVAVLERTDRLLSKVRVSGGGRCNVTHACSDMELMSRGYPRGSRFVRRSFHQFSPDDTVRWFAGHGVRLVAEPDGRMFPSTNRSETVVDCLLGASRRAGVEFLFRSEPVAVERDASGFRLTMRDGRLLEADRLCIATGGIRKAEQLAWLSSFGHRVEEPVPSLFTFNLPGHPIRLLTGVSVPDAAVRVEGARQEHRGAVLVTHWGLSGPAVLKASAWHARELHREGYRFPFHVRWLSGQGPAEVSARWLDMRRSKGGALVMGRSPFDLPARLWQYLVEASGIPVGCRWADLSARLADALAGHLLHHGFLAEGQTVFKEEFVTAGGIRTSEVDPSSMESRLVPGLYFAGEVLDVDGITGGYNFQHAWTSGWTAGDHVARSQPRPDGVY